MDMNRTYSVIVLRGTQVRRFVVSQSGVRYLLWAGLFLLYMGGRFLSDYVALQKIAKAQAQQEKNVSSLRERTKEVQELLSRWKGLQKRIEVSLPRRSRASSNGRGEDEELQEILSFLQIELNEMISSFPSDWPVRGRIVSGVGMRLSPWTGEEEFHSGIDIANPVGAPVHASGDAVVGSIRKGGGKGRTITLDHGQEITTQYAHLSEILVSEGDRVRKGQRIALVGNSGKTTGPHLHYEVRVNGIPINPRKAFMNATPGE